MMFLQKTVLIASVLFVASGVSAEKIEQKTARLVASHYAASLSTLRSAQEVSLAYTAGGGTENGLRSSTGYPMFYVYNIGEGNGFVFVAGDDVAYPVLGYAGTGSFNTDDMPVNLKSWLSFYENEIAAAVAAGIEASPETSVAWQRLLKVTGVEPVTVKYLSTAAWDQISPFNDLCPQFGGQRSLTGCVATAMAIAMKYYEWPVKGEGAIDYVSKYGKVPIKLTLGETYDWANMLPLYRSSSGGVKQWTDAQGNEVAKIMYHAGAAALTNYYTEWSDAYASDALHAFITNFGYDTGGYLAYRNLYSSAEWNEMLQAELDADRLLFYAGITWDEEGHQFIISGYNSDNYYFVNWGWGGTANGYYLLTALDPYGEVTTPPGLNAFSYEQSALIGLQKPVEGSTPRYEFFYFEHESFPYLGLRTDAPIITRGTSFTLSYSPFTDYGFRAFDGFVCVCLVDSEGNLKEKLGVPLRCEMESGDTQYDVTGSSYTISAEVAEGDKVQVMYSLDGKVWNKVRGLPGTVAEIPVGVELVANEPTLPEPTVTLAATSIDNEVVIYANGQTVIRDIRLFDFTGRLLKSDRAQQGETQVLLPVANLPSGFYLLTVGTDTGINRFKIRKR